MIWQVVMTLILSVENGLYCVNSWNKNDKLMAQVSSVDLRLVFCVWCDTAAVLGCCKSSGARMFT